MAAPRSNVLLQELHEKLCTLRHKKEAMVKYFAETKGHAYRRSPQVEKLDKAIQLVEQEIHLMDPFPQHSLRRGESEEREDGGTKSRDHAEASSALEASAMAMIRWLLDSLTGGGGGRTIGSNRDRAVRSSTDADDANFFAWIVGSLCDPYISIAVMQLDNLPIHWLASVIRASPHTTHEVMPSGPRRSILLKAINHRDPSLLALAMGTLAPTRPQLVSALGNLFEHRAQGISEIALQQRVAAATTQLIANGWVAPFCDVYMGPVFCALRSCISLDSCNDERGGDATTPRQRHEQQPPSSPPHTGSTRPGTAAPRAEDVEWMRLHHQKEWQLSQVVSQLADSSVRTTTLLRLPPKALHTLIYHLSACDQRPSTLAADANSIASSSGDILPILDLPTTVLVATGTCASVTSLVNDEHSSDVLKEPLWLRRVVKQAAGDRRRQCSLDLERTAEERFWTYFADELDRAWTEGCDEHVAAAFVIGGGDSSMRRATTTGYRLPIDAGMPSPQRRRTTAATAGFAQIPSVYVPPSGERDPGMNPIALYPQMTSAAFVVAACTITQLHPDSPLVAIDTALNGVKIVSRTRLNVRADAPAKQRGQYCYRVKVPLAPEVDGTYRIGWANHAFPVGLMEQHAPTSLGDTQAGGYGACFRFEPIRSGARGGSVGSPQAVGFVLDPWKTPPPTAVFISTPVVSYRVTLLQWFAGSRHSTFAVDAQDANNASHASETVATGMLSMNDVLQEDTGDNSDGRSAPQTVEITCLLDSNIGDVSFVVGRELEFPSVFQSPDFVVPIDHVSGALAWFPAATFGICPQAHTEAIDQTNQSLTANVTGSNASPRRKDLPPPTTATTSSPPAAHDGAAACRRPLTWTFDFLDEHYQFAPIVPSSRLIDVLHCVHDYSEAIIRFHGLLTVDPPPPLLTMHAPIRTSNDVPKGIDAVASPQRQHCVVQERGRVRDSLYDFIQMELHVQFNQPDVIPAVLLPKILDVDDILDLLMYNGRAGEALRRLNISDKSLMRAPQIMDRERDARWFPHLVRPAVQTKSRFGSMAAMKRSATHEQWNLLVNVVDGITCPPLHAALLLDRRDVVVVLMRSSAVNVNAADSTGTTPLILAVQFGFPLIVRYLVHVRGADVSIQNIAGHGPLHVALVNHQEQCLDALLEHPTAVGSAVLNSFSRGRSNAVCIAAKLGRADLVRKFAARGGLPCVPDAANVTALTFALRFRDADTAREVLEHAHMITREQLNAREKREPRGTALLYAANMGDAGILSKLLSMGADVTIPFSEPPCNVLHAAVASRCCACVNALLAVPAVQGTQSLLNGGGLGRGATPLHLAAEIGSVDMMLSLCRADADVNCSDAEGRTPLMVLLTSVEYNEAEAVSFTHAIKRRLRTEVADKSGRTTLFYAMAKGSTDILRILIESCGASVNALDMFGFTPLTFALAHNQEAAAQCLLHVAGSKINFMVARPNVPLPIEYAYQRGSVTVCRIILELGERCIPDLRARILAADDDTRAGLIGSWGDRVTPSIAQLHFRSHISTIPSGIVPPLPSPVGAHGTCASALLHWHTGHSGDPQHRRVSASCFGIAATVRPTAAERVAHRMLDATACGDDAIDVLQRLEKGELAVVRRGETHHNHAAETSGGVANDTGGDDVIDLDNVLTTSGASREVLLSSTTPMPVLIEQLVDMFGQFMPEVRTERALRLASTQVLLLLVEARTNAARHAFLPLSSGGYEMSVPRLEALALQALQLNREPSVVAELRALSSLASNHGRSFNVNVATRSKWPGRNVTMLHLAALGNNPAAVKYLLRLGADPVLEVNPQAPSPVADMDHIWHTDAATAVAVDAILSSSRIGRKNDAAPTAQVAMRLPCPLLCALRLGYEDILLSMLEHYIDGAENGDERAATFQLYTRKDDDGSVFVLQRVPILHVVVVLCPHHDWLSGQSLASLWGSLEAFSSHINTRDAVSGLTALQLAVVCGRSDIVEWALGRRGTNIQANRCVAITIARLGQLFDALGIRFVNKAALRVLVRHYRRYAAASVAKAPHGEVNKPFADADEDDDEDNAVQGEGTVDTDTVELSFVDVALVCCPSVVQRALTYGFELPSVERKDPLRETVTFQPDAPAAPTAMTRGLSTKALDRRGSRAASARRQSLSPAGRRGTTFVSPPGGKKKPPPEPPISPTALQLMWKGDSIAHRALRCLLHAAKYASPAGGQASGVPASPDSPLQESPLLRRASRSFQGSAIHFLPGRYVQRGNFSKHLRSAIEYMLLNFTEDMNRVVDEHASLRNEGEPVPASGVTAVASSDGSETAPLLRALLEIDIGLFAVDAHGDTPLHTAAAAGEASMVAALLATGHQWITLICRQIVRMSSRAPNTSALALHAKVLEVKTALVSVLNERHESVMDIVSKMPMTEDWFHATVSVLEWLPAGSKSRVGYAERLVAKVHPLKFPLLSISSGLLQGLALESTTTTTVTATSPAARHRPSVAVRQEGAGTVVSGAPEVAHENARVVSLVFLGLLYSLLNGRQKESDVVEVQRRLTAITSSSPRSLLEHLNPFVGVVILAVSKLSTHLHRSVQSLNAMSLNYRESSKDRALQRPSTAATLTPAAPRSVRPQTGAPRGAQPTLAHPQSASTARATESGIGSAISSPAVVSQLSSGERFAIQNYIPPSSADCTFRRLVRSSVRDGEDIGSDSGAALDLQREETPLDINGWTSMAMPLYIVEAVDDAALWIWEFMSAFAQDRAPSAQKAETDPAVQTQLVAYTLWRERVVALLVAAAHCGMEHVLVGAWHRMHVSASLLPELEKAAFVDATFFDSRLMIAAARSKRPAVLYHLILCGAPVSLQGTAARPTACPLPVNEIFFRMQEIADGSTSDKKRCQAPARQQEYLRQAARQCLVTMLHARCLISELTVQHVVVHPDLYDLNACTPIHHDTLLHVAVANRSLEAIVALAHNKKFTAGKAFNVHGLRAWEYATEPLILDHALSKRNPSMSAANLSIAFYAAVAVVPPQATDRDEYSMSGSAYDHQRHNKQRTLEVPPALIKMLHDNGFVLEEDASVEIGGKDTPVVKLTLSAASISQRAHLLFAQHEPTGPQKAASSTDHVARHKTAGADGGGDIGESALLQPAASRTSFARDCDVLELHESQREQVVLLSICDVLGGTYRHITDILHSDLPHAHNAAYASTSGHRSALPEQQSNRKRVGRQVVVDLKMKFVLDEGVSLCILPMYTA